MKCPSCGTELTNNEKFCTNCGSRVDGANDTPTGMPLNQENQSSNQPKQNSNQQPSVDTSKPNRYAISGFILSLVSLWVATFLIGSIAAVISGLAIGQVEKTGESGKGLAIAGLIISIAGIVLMIFLRVSGIKY